MSFYLQDPGDIATTYLVEVLVEQCKTSTGGGGSYAWATSRGINLLLENEHFLDFLQTNDFELVIGVDCVTDEKALIALDRLQNALSRLRISIFLNEYSGPLFHPKVCWFRRGSSGTLVTGSGNLTEGGLSRNWEAFTVTQLDASGIKHVEQQWQAWKVSYKDDLYQPLDPRVVARAKKNVLVFAKSSGTSGTVPKKFRAKRLPGNRRVGIKVSAPTTASAELGVLVAEIPKASNRWNQANFDRENYENFFGAKVGAQRFMFFRHVREDGEVGDTETRPSVAVKSHNWRFELAAASGMKYPTNGRPIGIFVRQAARNFLYQLLMPGEAGHKKLEALLAKHWQGSEANMRRIPFSRLDAETAWPESPIWNVVDADETEESSR